MLDPNQVVEVFKTIGTILPTATATATSSVGPIPTVVPDYPTFERIHHAGSTALWVAFGVFLVSTVVLAFLAWRTPVQKRLFHILATVITAIPTLTYYAQATGSGSTWAHFVIHEAHKHVPDTTQHIIRQVFWAHTVDSAITFPLVVLTLAFVAGISGANILVIIFAHFTLALTTFLAAADRSVRNGHRGSTTKWGWLVFAIVSFLVIAYQLIIPGRRAVKAKADTATGKLYAALGGYTLVVWILYLVVWAVTEGTRNWSVDAEVIAYAVLDLLAKPVFAFWLIFAYGKKSAALDGFWAHGLTSEGSVRLEDDD